MNFKEIVNENFNESVNKVMNNLAIARGVDPATIEEKSVGNNGFTPGQTVTFTGKVDIYAPKGITPYYAAFTKDGSAISVQSLMGISSLKGYQTSGEFKNVVDAKTKAFETVVASVGDDFDFDDVQQPYCRELYKFIAYLQETECLKDVTATYMGQVVRPYLAKKAGKMGETSWAVGDDRCQIAKLWKY